MRNSQPVIGDPDADQACQDQNKEDDKQYFYDFFHIFHFPTIFSSSTQTNPS